MKNNVRSIDGGKKGMSEQEKNFQQLVENLPLILEMYEIKAKIKREYYLHLVKEGFSKEEALEIAATDPTL